MESAVSDKMSFNEIIVWNQQSVKKMEFNKIIVLFTNDIMHINVLNIFKRNNIKIKVS